MINPTIKLPHNEPNSLVQNGEYSPEGVDLTLIRWMLSLTPRERLMALQQAVNSVGRLRHARIIH